MSKFQSISLPTLSDSATMKEVENESRKMGLDILNKLNSVADAQYPVGYVYTQYSGQTAPVSLFGGTWTDITSTVATGQDKIGYIYVQYPNQSDAATIFGGTWLNVSSLYAGLFFRAEGGSALAFNAGNQADAIIAHRHVVGVSGAGSFAFGSTTISSSSVMTLVGAGTNGPNTGDPLTVATASETRPVNTTIRVWSRSGYSTTYWQRTGGSLTTTTGTSVVTGIYDSGTNSNGNWIRFTDGTIMQWGNFASTTYPQAMTFPISFVDTNYRLIPAHSESATANIVSNISPTTMTVSGCSIWSNVGNTAAQRLSGSVDWQATGKWK